MIDSSTSTLQRVAQVLGVGQKHEPPNPFQTILRMQHFQLWGFIFLILAIALIIWLIQKKLENIDKQYKEQFIILHRLFKSHQDLQVKVHQNKNKPEPEPQPQSIQTYTTSEPEPQPIQTYTTSEPEPETEVSPAPVVEESVENEEKLPTIAEEKQLSMDDIEELPDFLN